jgi:glycosyltransferase 2 family protein
VIGWALASVLIGAGFAAVDAGVVYLGAIFAAGWVAGQIVVPVPAGIGVREAAIIWLAGPEIGYEAALAFALLTRVLHVAVDGLLIVGAAGRARWT